MNNIMVTFGGDYDFVLEQKFDVFLLVHMLSFPRSFHLTVFVIYFVERILQQL
jgi:hypothetical protein